MNNLARLDKLNIKMLGLAWEHSDNGRAWADDRTGKAPANVRATVLGKQGVQRADKTKRIEGSYTKKARLKIC